MKNTSSHYLSRRAVVLLASALLAGAAYAQAGKAKPSKQPNIVFFIVDDMGWQDCSVPFGKDTSDWNRRYHTPNMEQLAAQGMKLTNAYAAPVCSPTRVSLMTGMNAAHHRVTNWTLNYNKSVDAADSLLQSPDWNINGMSPVDGIPHTVLATPLPQMLKQAGYYNIHVGKAHFGARTTPAEDPIKIGFDVNIAGHAAGGLGSYLGEANYGNKPGEHTLPWGVPGLEKYHGTETFVTEALTIEALKELDKARQQDKPFFLYMSHYAVHIPLTADKRFIDKYLRAGLPQKEAEYCSMVEGMDKSLGDIMHYLQQHKLAENTIIIFMSDNGGFAMAPRAGEPYTQNKPLRSGKGSVYEGGTRVPMLVKWPGVVKPGIVSEQYMLVEDLYPTLLDMAGTKQVKTIQQLDGKSLVPHLKNPALRDTLRPLVWHLPNKWTNDYGPGINFKSAIRQGSWKLVYNHKTEQCELYNLANDIGETKDLSKLEPKRTEALARLLAQQLKGYDAQMPVHKTSGIPVAMPDKIFR